MWGLGVRVTARFSCSTPWHLGDTSAAVGIARAHELRQVISSAEAMYCLFKEIRAFWHKMQYFLYRRLVNGKN